MHNNGYVDKSRMARKTSYTVVEAAVHWARSEGARTADDPRIKRYTDLILEALRNGDLKVSNKETSTISSIALSDWIKRCRPDAHPVF